MRRLMSIAAFALVLAMPLWAQRGGGHAGGGHGGGSFGGHSGGVGHSSGFGGHSGGFSSGSHSIGAHSFSGSASRFSGSRPGPIAGRGFSRGGMYTQRGFSRGPYLHNAFHGRNGSHTTFRTFRTYGFRNNCYGYPCRYGWGYGSYYDPWLWNWWWDSGSQDDDYNNNLAIANQMNQQSLEEQRMWRQEEADSDQDAYDPRASSPRNEPDSPAVQKGESFLPATVLVFRDRHKLEIRNYAIVGQTLWNFAPQHTEKIPLSDLDLPATAKANDERGVTFRVPVSGEAQ